LAAKYFQGKYKTAKEMILGGRQPNKVLQELCATEIPLTWWTAATNHLLAGLTTKKSRTTLKLPKHQENVPPTKDITLFDGYPARKDIYLAALDRQEKLFTWR